MFKLKFWTGQRNNDDDTYRLRLKFYDTHYNPTYLQITII